MCRVQAAKENQKSLIVSHPGVGELAQEQVVHRETGRERRATWETTRSDTIRDDCAARFRYECARITRLHCLEEDKTNYVTPQPASEVKIHSNKPGAFLAKHDIGGSDAEKSVKAELRQQFRSVYIVFPYFGKATMRGEELS